jgi:sarcosine oxidase subunit alpha
MAVSGYPQINRLAAGGRIDRARPITFTFNGKDYPAYAGDTLASALLANGISIVSRSFKYHRPRGIVAAGSEESNAILQIGTGATTQPNLRATQVELYDGLVARSTKGWPNVNFDVAALSDVFSRVLGAGFYYKTFMFPKYGWDVYEKFIRHSAGLGTAPRQRDPDHYDHRNVHCDVLIAGAGPAGLMAALAAGRTGARVIIADEQSEFGGSLLATNDLIDGKPAADWVGGAIAELDRMPEVVRLPRSTVFGYYDHNFLGILERRTDHLGEHIHDEALERRTDHLGEHIHGEARQREWRVRARQVILAQGAFERPLVFSNNDRPGIMLASAVSTYINRYSVCPGKRAVVFTNNDAAYEAALNLHHAGASVAIIDSRTEGAAALAEQAHEKGIPVMTGSIVTNARGGRRVRGVDVVHWDGDANTPLAKPQPMECDLVAVSGGFSPAVHLHSQSGGRNTWDNEHHCFVPGESVQESVSAGSCNGTWSLDECLAEGAEAGRLAASQCGFDIVPVSLPSTEAVKHNSIEALWRVPAHKDPDRCPKQFIDFQTDVSVADVRLAIREGYRNVEHVKRYTAMGFGTDQGKLGNINGMAVIAECLGKSIPEVGTTTFRPAYTPVTFGAGAGESVGDLYDPVRKTAIHEWHENAGAPMEVVGQWLRPWYFPKENEDIHQAVARECLAVRNSVGMMDASTLGKIDVNGPDAVAFLERIYTHDVGKMKIGRCAYGIMLGEDGMLMDDGVMARVGEQRFYLTTTTGGAARVMSWLELWLQTEWPELKVHLTSLTDHFSTIAVAGPNSRKVIEKLGCDIDLNKDSFPFMSVKAAILAGMPVQLFRVSFSGELAFEINIDSNYAHAMWQAVMAAGGEYEITPYGTDTMHVLRAEKGFVIVGQDTDGSVTPIDLRMNWLLSKDKDFIGKRSLSRSDCTRSDRKQLVGLTSLDNESVIPEGAQLVDDPDKPVPVPMCGHVTSSYRSATLEHPIALGLVANGHARKDETLYALPTDGRRIAVKITSPVFYDPKGERQNV